MSTLVTGADGFIGSRIVHNLVARGEEVTAFVRPGTPLRRISNVSKIRIVRCDLADHEEVSRLIPEILPRRVVHLAWFTKPGLYWQSKKNISCIEDGIHLAGTLASTGCERLLVTGTCAEYDWRFGVHDESVTPTWPHSLYGATKHALHVVLDNMLAGTGLSLVWPRLYFVYGHDEAPGRLVSNALSSIARGEDFPCTEGLQVRDYIEVEDLASALVAVLYASVCGSINVGSGHPVSVRHLVERLFAISKSPARPLFGALPAMQDQPPLLCPELGRLRNEVGWDNARSIDMGIEKMMADKAGKQSRGAPGQ